MRLRRPLALAALLAPGLLFASCGSGGPARPKNLLIVCVDTLRADELGAYGAQPSRTPALDRLAGASVVFERAHSAASWTLPSVASTFTSYFPSTTQLWTFESRLSDSFTTLAERFHAAGFATHGVASHVFFDGKYGLQQGFDSFDDELCHRKGEPGWQPITSPLVSAKAAKWLDERAASGAAEPWLLFAHFSDPHVDYLDHESANPAQSKRPERERYRSEIAFTDGHVGTLLDALARSPFAADTVVVFFSDHGESFGEHRGIEKHSYGLYEEELRVPLFLRVPGVAPRRVADPVRSVDLAPTLFELFGLERDPDGEGVSLVPLLAGEGPPARPQLAEIRLKDGFHANALVRERYKLYQDTSRERFELYDLGADADERHDLAAEQPELLEQLKRELGAALQTAQQKGASFAPGAPLEHTPEELQNLRDLGYGGGGEEPETKPAPPEAPSPSKEKKP